MSAMRYGIRVTGVDGDPLGRSCRSAFYAKMPVPDLLSAGLLAIRTDGR